MPLPVEPGLPLTPLTFLNGDLLLKGSGLESKFNRATCPCCGLADCVNDCGGSLDGENDRIDALNRQGYNAGLDAIESLMLALVYAGALTESEKPQVNAALTTCLDAIEHHFLG